MMDGATYGSLTLIMTINPRCEQADTGTKMVHLFGP